MSDSPESIKDIAENIWKNNRPLAIVAIVALMGVAFILYKSRASTPTPTATPTPVTTSSNLRNSYESTTIINTTNSPSPTSVPTPTLPSVPVPTPTTTPTKAPVMQVNNTPLISNAYQAWFGRGGQVYYGTSIKDQKHFNIPTGYTLRAGSNGRYWLIKGNIQQLLSNNFHYNGL